MTKLQLYITMNQSGFKNIMDINGDDRVRRYVTDVSDALTPIEYDHQAKNIFYLIKYCQYGTFIVILRTIPPTESSHLAAWLLVPYDILISDYSIGNIVNKVVETVQQSRITNEAHQALCNLLDSDFENLPSPAAMVANGGNEYAHRFYNGDSGFILSDLIGRKRYQTSYLQFAGVLLVNKTICDTVSGPDITDDPLEQMVSILPPKPGTTKLTPTLFGQPFNRAFLAPLMGSVDIVWTDRDGTSVDQTVQVSRPNMMIQPPVLQGNDGSRSGEPFNGIDIKSGDNNDDNSGDGHSRLSQLTGTLTDIGSTVKDKSVSAARRVRRWSTSTPLHTNIVWGASGLVLGVILTLLCQRAFSGTQDATNVDATQQVVAAADNKNEQNADTPKTDAAANDAKAADNAAENAETPKSEQQAKPEEQPKPQPTTLQDAKAYLDTHNTWTKEEMDKYPDLAGLFDDLNSMDKSKLSKVWGPKLKGSARFDKLVFHCKNALGHNKKPRVPEGQTKFLKPGDKQVIYVQRYLNTIDP